MKNAALGMLCLSPVNHTTYSGLTCALLRAFGPVTEREAVPDSEVNGNEQTNKTTKAAPHGACRHSSRRWHQKP